MASIHMFEYLRIAPTPEHWAGATVWIEPSDVLASEIESLLCGIQIINRVRKEDELRTIRCRCLARATGEKAKLVAAVDTREDPLVFKVEQTDQGPRVQGILDEELRGIIGGYARRKHTANAALG